MGSGSTCDGCVRYFTDKYATGNTYAEVLDLEVVEDEREARRALAQADTSTREVDGEAELGRPRGVGVGEREDLRRP